MNLPSPLSPASMYFKNWEWSPVSEVWSICISSLSTRKIAEMDGTRVKFNCGSADSSPFYGQWSVNRVLRFVTSKKYWWSSWTNSNTTASSNWSVCVDKTNKYSSFYGPGIIYSKKESTYKNKSVTSASSRRKIRQFWAKINKIAQYTKTEATVPSDIKPSTKTVTAEVNQNWINHIRKEQSRQQSTEMEVQATSPLKEAKLTTWTITSLNLSAIFSGKVRASPLTMRKGWLIGSIRLIGMSIEKCRRRCWMRKECRDSSVSALSNRISAAPLKVHQESHLVREISRAIKRQLNEWKADIRSKKNTNKTWNTEYGRKRPKWASNRPNPILLNFTQKHPNNPSKTNSSLFSSLSARIKSP